MAGAAGGSIRGLAAVKCRPRESYLRRVPEGACVAGGKRK